MDTLLLISGELLLFPIIAAAAVVAELVMGVLLGAVQVALGPLRRRRARSSGVAVRVPGLGVLRKLRSWLTTLAMAVLVTVVAADLFFFEGALRWMFQRLDAAAGLEVDFEQANGSFVAGRVELRGLVVRGERGTVIDVQADRFAIDVAMLEVLATQKRVQTVEVEGLRGHVERREIGAGKSGVRRSFRVDTLALSDLSIDFADHTRDRPVQAHVEIEHLEAAPVRSDYALFDLLYGATGSGAVEGLPFEVATTHDESGRTTTWRAPKLPLALAAPYLGAGGRYIESGHVEVEVRDAWLTERDPPEVSMHYRVVLHDLKMAVPEELGPSERALVVPLTVAVEKLGREIPLEFSIDLDEERFRGAMSLEAIGLWQAASGALAKSMMDKTGLDLGKLRRFGKVGGALLDEVKGE